jgi:hypothetical protein
MATQLIIRKPDGKLELTNTDTPNAYDNEVVFTGNAVSTISIEDGVYVQRDNVGGGSRKLFAVK